MIKHKRNEYLRLISFIRPQTLPYLIGLLGCSLIDASITTVVAFMLKNLYDAAVNKQMDQVINICIILSTAIVVLCILSPLMNYLLASTVKRIMYKIRLMVFQHVEKIPVRCFEDIHSGDYISRLINDIGVIEAAYTQNIRIIGALFFSGIFSAVYMLLMNWKISIILFLVAMVSTYVNKKFANSVRKLSDDLQSNISFMTQYLTDILAGFNIIKLFQLNEIVLKKYSQKNKEIADISVTRSKKFAILDSANFLLMWINNGGILTFGTFMMLNGGITLGTVLAMAVLQQQIVNLFGKFGNLIVQLQSSLAGAARVFEVLDIPVEEQRYDIRQCEGGSMIEIQEGVFSYKADERVLDGLSMKVEKGKVAALVGTSGGGKSTLIKIIHGLYQLDSGCFILNGKPVHKYTFKQIRKMMAYVPQDAYLFDGTIEDNIRYGRMDATKNEIITAARMANAHGFILEQQDGYKTKIGERGVRLSGGQKQRIAIARALLKNAPVLLLDEATSALDSDSEQLVQEALNTLMEGRTTIVIAHRLSTIKDADVIYVIGKGKVLEKGTHEELLSAEGNYKRLYNTQFKTTAVS